MSTSYRLLCPVSICISIAILFCAVLPQTSRGEAVGLSEADRIALIERLEIIKKQSDDRVSGLYRNAINAYRSAIVSDDKTMDLYLNCLEKVRYEDQKRKSQEFREWKRKNKDKLNSSSMRMALRHQLSWLLLSIEAARMEGDVSELGDRAIKHLDQIFANAEKLKDHRSILSQNALGSVFAQAYKLNIKVEDWPRSALDIAQVYDKVVMPPLRQPGRVNSLRSAWNHRILHEGMVVEKWSEREGKRVGKKDAMRPPELERFMAEKRPQLLWDMEIDCFEAGDERTSALRMLKHVETYLTHKDAPTWIEEFQELVQPEAEVDDAAVAED
jgi:hypothetical protein